MEEQNVSQSPLTQEQVITPTQSTRSYKFIYLFVGIFALLSIGFTFYLLFSNSVQNTTKHLKNVSSLVNEVEKPQSKVQNVLNKSGVIYLSDGPSVVFDSGEGKDKTVVNSVLDKEVSNVRGYLSASYLSPDRKYLFGYDQKKAYIYNFSSGILEEFDFQNVMEDFGYEEVFFYAWDKNSKDIVLGGNTVPNKLPGNIKRGIGLYDVEAKKVTVLFADEVHAQYSDVRVDPIYYDSFSTKLFFTDQSIPKVDAFDGFRETTAIAYDIQTKQKTQFKEPTVMTAHGGRSWSKYYIRSNAVIDPYKRTSLEIFDTADPGKVIGKIVLPEGKFFDDSMGWSHNGELFSIQVSGSQVSERGSFNSGSEEIHIYQKDGTLKQTFSLPIHSHATGFFSTDDTQIILYQESSSKNSTNGWWKIYEVSTGKLIKEAKNVSINQILSFTGIE